MAARCDGVPFYIEQVVAGLSQTGVPEALYEPLFARLRASANVVPVVEAAAVIGRHIDRALLCSVVDLSDDELDDVIDELEDALVLEPWGADSWRFRHELLREVAAELAPPSVRRGLHAKVADALIGAAASRTGDWSPATTSRPSGSTRRRRPTSRRRADARRRGALAEARTYLTQALAQLDRATPGPDRDRREMAARLERGFLTAAAEGYQSRAAAADFERCLQLGGTDLRDDELFATLAALGDYYFVRADLRRAAQVIESLRAGLEERQWFRPAIEVLFGMVACLRGEFDAAISHLEAATAGLVAADHHDVDAVWRFVPNEPIASARIHLALVALVRGDLAGAETELALAARRAEGLGFPQGPYMHAWTRFMETWLRIEAGQLDRAAVLAADLSEASRAARLRRVAAGEGRSCRPSSAPWPHSSADDVDPTKLAAHIATITTLLDTLRTLEMNMYSTFYDAVLGRLLIAAGQPEAARERLDTGLAAGPDTGMCFYDAELLRLRAHTHDRPGRTPS